MSKRQTAALLAAAVGSTCLVGQWADAAAYTFKQTGAGTYYWNQGANWNPGAPANATDTVVYLTASLAAAPTLTIENKQGVSPNITVNSIFVDNDGGLGYTILLGVSQALCFEGANRSITLGANTFGTTRLQGDVKIGATADNPVTFVNNGAGVLELASSSPQSSSSGLLRLSGGRFAIQHATPIEATNATVTWGSPGSSVHDLGTLINSSVTIANWAGAGATLKVKDATLNTSVLDVGSGGALLFLGTRTISYSGNSAITATAGTVTFRPSSSGIVEETHTFNGNTGGTLTISAPLFPTTSYTGHVRKIGSGTMILTASNAYGGQTIVDGGLLLVNNANGSGTGPGAVTVNGGSLGGIGRIAGATTITASGTLSPGSSIGTLTFGSNLTVKGTLKAELGTPGAVSTFGTADLASVTGNVALSGSTLQLIDNANANSQGSAGAGRYNLISYTGTRSNTIFATVTNPLSATLHEKVVYDDANKVKLEMYRLASTDLVDQTITFADCFVGSTAPTQTIALTNTAANDGFSEILNATFGTASGGVTTSGSVTGLSAGSSSANLLVGVSTTSAGDKSGSVSVAMQSDGAGTSGYGTSNLLTRTINVTGKVLDRSNASFASEGDVNSTSLDFGTVQLGSGDQTRTVSIYNLMASAGFAAKLDMYTISYSGTTSVLSDSGTFVGLAAGFSKDLVITLSPRTAGAFSETITLGVRDDASISGYQDNTGPFTITVTGDVTAVPEPTTLGAGLTMLGLMGGMAARRRRVE